MSDQSKSPTPDTTNNLSVKFVFERSPLYRTIHVDGGWARLDPYANIHLTVYSEKPQMPISSVMQNLPGGQWILEPGKTQFAHDAPLVRELDCDMVMSVPAATAVRDALDGYIKMAMEHMEKTLQRASEVQKQQTK